MNTKTFWKTVRRPGWAMLAGAGLGAAAIISLLLLWPQAQRALFALTDREPRAVGTVRNVTTGEEATNTNSYGEAASIRLSDQARRNIGLELGRVELTEFERTITVPAIIFSAHDHPTRPEMRTFGPSIKPTPK